MIRISRRLRRGSRILAVLIIGVLLAFPLIYLILGGLMSTPELNSFPPKIIPAHTHWANFSQAWTLVRPRSAINSVIFTVVTVVLQWALCITAGLALAKMRFRGGKVITAVLGLSLFVPTVTTLVPTFIVTDKLSLINTYPGLILPIAAQTGFGTLLFRQFIGGLPEELVDAARMDGAGWWTILVRLIEPLARPATGAYMAISVITAWNMYLWPLVEATKPSQQVLTETLAPLASGALSANVPENIAFAATVITTLPLVLAFLLAQRTFVRGLAGSGVE